MTYLDTRCFVKLYYPEADSAQVIAKVQGKHHFTLHVIMKIAISGTTS